MPNLAQKLDTQYKIEKLKERAQEYASTSNRYRFIDSTNVLDWIEEALDGRSYDLRLIHGGKKTTHHVIEYTLRDGLSINNDTVKPKLFFSNSFNGESSLKVNVGLLRLACSNGLVVGENIYSDRIIHLNTDETKHKIATIQESTTKALEFLTHYLAPKLETMLQPLTTDQETFVVNALGLSKRQTEKIIDRLSKRPYLRVADQQQNAWTLYNICNEVIKENSRSELAVYGKNLNLMDQIIELSYD